MGPRDGIRLSNEANRAIQAGGLTVAQAQQYINGLEQFLIYTNLAPGFQDTINRLQAVVDAGGEPIFPPVDNAMPPGDINPQTARTQGAVAQNPGGNTVEPLVSVQEPIAINRGLGSIEEPIEDSGLDAPVKTLAQTQATLIDEADSLIAGRVNRGLVEDADSLLVRTGGGATTLALSPGVGDGRADNPPPSSNATQRIVNSTFGKATGQRIITQPNVLDQYASYTYQISWYLLTTTQYNRLIKQPRRSISGWTLLMQSGGAPIGNNTTVPSVNNAVRSSKFPVDYYLDDLEIETKLPGGGTGMANSETEIKFKVTEPNGITLVQNLFRANQELNRPTNLDINASQELDTTGTLAEQTTPTPTNYLKAHYCLAIRFYGYDSAGNLSAPIIGRYNRQGSGQQNSTDPQAVVEKIIPFLLTELKFTVTKSQVEYRITGAPVNQHTAFSQSRGTIPKAVQLSGTTVKDVLIGNAPAAELPVLAGERTPQASPAQTGPLAAEILTNTGAGVDALGNFTGESESPTQVGA
jgi:hypothetical protein